MSPNAEVQLRAILLLVARFTCIQEAPDRLSTQRLTRARLLQLPLGSMLIEIERVQG